MRAWVLVVLVLPLAGCVTSEVPEPVLVEAPVWTPGDWWTYHVVEEEGETLRRWNETLTYVASGTVAGVPLHGLLDASGEMQAVRAADLRPVAGRFQQAAACENTVVCPSSLIDLTEALESDPRPAEARLAGPTWFTFPAVADQALNVTIVRLEQASTSESGYAVLHEWENETTFDGAAGQITYHRSVHQATVLEHEKVFHRSWTNTTRVLVDRGSGGGVPWFRFDGRSWPGWQGFIDLTAMGAHDDVGGLRHVVGEDLHLAAGLPSGLEGDVHWRLATHQTWRGPSWPDIRRLAVGLEELRVSFAHGGSYTVLVDVVANGTVVAAGHLPVAVDDAVTAKGSCGMDACPEATITVGPHGTLRATLAGSEVGLPRPLAQGHAVLRGPDGEPYGNMTEAGEKILIDGPRAGTWTLSWEDGALGDDVTLQLDMLGHAAEAVWSWCCHHAPWPTAAWPPP